MVRATKSVGFKQTVRVTNEIAIGEKQELDQIVHWRVVRTRTGSQIDVGGVGRHAFGH